MGQIFVKSYFPTGYAEWLDNTKFQDVNINFKDREACKEEYDREMDVELYDKWVLDSDRRKIIEVICQGYSDNHIKILKDRHEFLSSITPEAELWGRVIYDHFVGYTFCVFWMELIKQPRESIRTYYRLNVPKVKDVFYAVEKEHNLQDEYPAKKVIDMYKHYTS